MTNLKLVGTAVVDTEEKPTFAAFWLLYPRRVAKFEAEREWNRLTAADQLEAIVGLVAWRQEWIRRGEMQFVPYPSTWLHQHRWTDELPENWGASHASHQAAAIPVNGERAAMPDHVKALIAKLKGGK